MYLHKIINYKKTELEEKKQKLPMNVLKSQLQFMKERRGFKEALSNGNGTRIIAEVKKASPSKGVIREDFDHMKIAKTYEREGSAAISVLTDSHFFQGDIEFLSQIRCVVETPLLRKDFIIDEYQVLESMIYGADALLLIASVLSEKELRNLYDMTRSLSMEVLVEVHNKGDLKKAKKIGAEIIGINNRDLKSFKTDINTTAKLSRLISEEIIVVSESGINTKEEIEYLKKTGANAFLIGEALMREKNPGVLLRELINC